METEFVGSLSTLDSDDTAGNPPAHLVLQGQAYWAEPNPLGGHVLSCAPLRNGAVSWEEGWEVDTDVPDYAALLNACLQCAWLQNDRIVIDGEAYEYLTLRRNHSGGVDVMGWARAPDDSVLAGQMVKHFLDAFETEEEARVAYPQAENFSSAWSDPQASLRHLPGEDDPVAGGMYPDDWTD